jgi:hypothetical protein
MGQNFYERIMHRKYTVTEAVIVFIIYMAILIGYTVIMV